MKHLFNVVYDKVGRVPSADVVIELLKTTYMPIWFQLSMHVQLVLASLDL